MLNAIVIRHKPREVTLQSGTNDGVGGRIRHKWGATRCYPAQPAGESSESGTTWGDGIRHKLGGWDPAQTGGWDPAQTGGMGSGTNLSANQAEFQLGGIQTVEALFLLSDCDQ